jgi:hypothetical protein
MSNSLNYYCGDGKTIKVIVRASSGATITIDKAWFTVKDRPEEQLDADAVIQYNSEDDPSNVSFQQNGTASPEVWVVIDGSDTQAIPGTYTFDVQILRSGETDPDTVVVGFLRLAQDVTRARS